MTVNVTFETAYNVNFTETGLPVGTDWTVSVRGTGVRSATDTVSFALANGTYNYTVAPIDGYRTSWNGSVTVTGADVSVAIAFARVVYPVVFAEPDSPGGTFWSVALGSGSNSSNTTIIRFMEPNGTYAWNITPIGGYTTLWKGKATVVGPT